MSERSLKEKKIRKIKVKNPNLNLNNEAEPHKVNPLVIDSSTFVKTAPNLNSLIENESKSKSNRSDSSSTSKTNKKNSPQTNTNSPQTTNPNSNLAELEIIETASDFIIKTLIFGFREHTKQKINDILKFSVVCLKLQRKFDILIVID